MIARNEQTREEHSTLEQLRLLLQQQLTGIISIFLACYQVAKNEEEKFCYFVGPPFCGIPVRPNMLNMPKSASVWRSGQGRINR